jgi:hypothetical protein
MNDNNPSLSKVKFNNGTIRIELYFQLCRDDESATVNRSLKGSTHKTKRYQNPSTKLNWDLLNKLGVNLSNWNSNSIGKKQF